MKGLKRSRDVVDDDGDQVMGGASDDEIDDEVEMDEAAVSKKSKIQL